MRRGHYRGDSGGRGRGRVGGRGAYGTQLNQQQENRSGYQQGRHQEQQEKDPNHHHNQWRWERDGGHNKLPMDSMSPRASFDEGKFSILLRLAFFFLWITCNLSWVLLRNCYLWNYGV